MLRNQQLSECLPEAVVNIDAKSRSNIFTWRGQFSPQLIESLLKAYANPNSRVFDPFLGSGTVLYEAGLLDLSAIGCEINPAAVSFSKVYELANETLEARRVGIQAVHNFISQYSTKLENKELQTTDDFQTDILNFHETCTNKITKIILNALIVGLDFKIKAITAKRVLVAWQVLRLNIEKFPVCTKVLRCYEADARKVPVEENSFDLVITSPPYINVFNYHQNYRQSVELLGIDVLSVARSEIGSNRKFRGNRFLTVTQYCMDMALVFEELKRICTLESKIIFIVGRESNVRKIAFYNAALLKKVAFANGLILEGQQHRVFGNKFGQSIFEEILRFKIVEKKNLGTIELARNIGIEALKLNLDDAVPEIKIELLDAIEKSKTIKPSPYLGE